MLKAIAACALPALLIALAPIPAAADLDGPATGDDAYAGGLTGYDVAHLGCGGELPYGNFGIVGVNSGRPFHYNPCLGDQFRLGQAVYVNTAYDLAYGNRISATCAAAAASALARASERTAWGIGCSQAEGDVLEAATALPELPAMWWLDVEVMNSWDSYAPLNRRALEGAVWVLSRTGRPVGAYSTGYQWGVITGGWRPDSIAANWVAGAQSSDAAPLRCGRGFTGAPVWLVQFTRGKLDLDFSC